MIWTLEHLVMDDSPKTCINGMWVPARPLNNKYRTLWVKLKESWAVFTGKAECFTWPGGQ